MSRAILHHVLVALALFALWVLLSGMLDAFHLGLGVVSAIGVALLSGRLLYTQVDPAAAAPGAPPERQWLSLLRWHRILWYGVTMLWEIVLANFAVAKKVLGPTARIRPTVFRLSTDYRSELSRVVLANSIILTPGTTVLDVTPEGELVIHALDVAGAEGTTDGPLPRRVRWAFEPGGRSNA